VAHFNLLDQESEAWASCWLPGTHAGSIASNNTVLFNKNQ